MKLIQAIQEVIALAEAADRAQQKTREDFNPAGVLSMRDALALPEPKEVKALEEKLVSYDGDIVRKIEVLYYYGRGDDDDLEALSQELDNRFEPVDRVIYGLMEKYPGLIAEMLKTAVVKASKAGIDLNSF